MINSLYSAATRFEEVIHSDGMFVFTIVVFLVFVATFIGAVFNHK